MNQILRVILCFAVLTVFLAGCEEVSQSEIKRAKLIGSENIQLKKQLELKDKEIQQFKDLMAKRQEENTLALKQSGDTHADLLKSMVEIAQELEALQEENVKLKAQIEELKSSGTDK